MNHETPLHEVAQILPQTAAAILDGRDPLLQEAVLTNLRAILAFWEENGYHLDPVTFEGVMVSFVVTLIPMHEQMWELVQSNARLRQAISVLKGGIG